MNEINDDVFIPDSAAEAELQKLRDRVVLDCKSIVFAFKLGCTERELRHEYKLLNDTDVPFRKLGYANLHQLMCTISDVAIGKNETGDLWVYHALYNEATEHIGRLVAGQRDNEAERREQMRSAEIDFVKKMRARRSLPLQLFNRDNMAAASQQNLFTSNNAFYDRFSGLQPYNMSEQNLTTAESVTFPPPPPQPIPDLIKQQIETVLRAKSDQKYKMKVSEFFDLFIEIHKFILNPRLFGYDSLVPLLHSLTDLVFVEPIRSYTNAFNDDEYVRYEVGLLLRTYPFRDYPDVAQINEDLTPEGKIRSKRIAFFELDELNAVDHFVVHLIDADDRLYIHWTQVARMFGLRRAAFKAIVLFDTEHIKTFKLNKFNACLFDLVERKLGIDLKETDEAHEIHFVVYDRLRAFSDYIFEENSTAVRRKVNVYISKLWLR